MKEFNSKELYLEALELTKTIAVIPAPSGFEDKRAEFVLNYVKKIGYDNAYIDSAKNVIWKLDGETEDYTLFCAHTDVVFPDMDSLPLVEDDICLWAPGVGDDTVCVAQMLIVCKYLKEIGYKPTKSLIFVANSCEEGLGNLKGSRQIFADNKNITRMFTFDGVFRHVINKSVGSHRFKVVVKTIGGHSYNAFGNRNSIAVMSKIINKIYEIQVPEKEGAKTTYNVGLINGGTSINTIAQEVEMFCEYRSDDLDCFNIMKANFEKIFADIKNEEPEAEIIIELVGDRPCMGIVDKDIMAELSELVKGIQEKYSKGNVALESGSTDCNIPHSLGIPAICVGTYDGGGVHTREESLVKESIEPGLDIVYELIINQSK